MALNVYEIITQRIIDSLEHNVVPWRKSWKSSPPQNLLSKKPYRGVNVFLLDAMRHTSPYWLTFRQAKAKGGSVKRGEKGTPVVFWKVSGGQSETSEDDKFRRFILRYYTVFNLSQCEGIEAPATDSSETLPFQPIEACERIVEMYPHAPELEEGGDQAAYHPSTDTIRMPPRDSFTSEESYYATRFHEMIHSTGHSSRLDRQGISQLDSFGSHSYSYEELVAECGSAFLCGEAGILDTTIDNSTAYIRGWVSKLRSEPKWIIKASGEAAKAADLILRRNQTEQEEEDA